MRKVGPFQRDDLEELDSLLKRADEVVAMREVAAGEHDPFIIGLRHDVDNTLEPCLELATWEFLRGYRSTYFVLHDSPYWDNPELESTLYALAESGHEVGIHANALAESVHTGRDQHEILHNALDRLRGWGHKVIGVAAHGDPACYDVDGELRFVNDEQFVECPRPELGPVDREVAGIRLDPLPLAAFALEYAAERLPRALALSDSSNRWNDWSGIIEEWPSVFGQLHILQHPCWWIKAFEKVVA